MQNLREFLSSESAYRNTKPIKENIQDEEILNSTISILEEIFEYNDSKPMEKVLAMRLTKELMDLHYDCVVFAVTSKLVFMIEDIILIDLKKNDRGKYYFSSTPDQHLMVLGNTLIRLALESIFVWNLWHPNNLAITQIYARLKEKGVQFPKLHYFNAQKVKEYYLTVKETSKNNTIYKQQSLMLNEQQFEQLKHAIEKNQYSDGKLHEINEELKCNKINYQEIKNVNDNQKQFIENFSKAYQSYLINQKMEDFNNQIHSICQEYDEGSSQKKQYSGIQFCNYSTDKQSSQFSRSISSQNSQNKNGSNSKETIEQLLYENQLIQAQIQSFELPQQSSIRSSTNTNSKQNSQY